MPKNKKIMIEDIYIKAIGIEEIKNAARIEMNEDDENDIKKVVNQLKSENKDVAQFFANQLFSRIMGHDDIKKALLLQQIKGVNKKLGEDSLRANSHILIVSDPGVAKSTMLNTISKIPGNTLTSMTGASAVGLIASVQKSQSLLGDESWRASLGPIPKADGGSCCIDEFAVNPEAQKVLLTPMENEYGPVDKASIHIKLPTRTAILAACNPKFGRFDPDLSIVEQINMKPQMLSRFDMIFVIRDLPDKEKDAKIMRHILEMHANAYNQTVNDNKSVVEVAGVEITQEFIHKYIYYARSQAPRIPHPNEDAETTTKILSIYQTMRFLGSHINPRSGEAFIRVAEQIAKSKLKSGTIEVDDVVEAIGMIQESYKSIAYNAETGSFDMDKVSGISKEDTNLQKDIFKVIKKNGLISEIEIIENFTEKGYPEEKIKAKLKKLISNGDIDEPKTGKFRVI
jgi:replicative DNA helicase Mcm